MRIKSLTVASWTALAALLLGTGSCTDSSTLVGGHGSASFSIQPVFSGPSLATAPVVDRIHLVVTRPPSTKVLLDRVVNVSPGATSVTVGFKLDLLTNDDQLLVSIDLLQSGTVLYHGTQTVEAKSGVGRNNNATITVNYVGPGAGATTVTISPSLASISSAGSQQFSTVVKDGSGTVLGDVPVVWSISDATLGKIDANGLFAGAGRRGSVTITATTWGGVAGSTKLTLLPAANRIVVVGGNSQAAPPGSPLPLPVVLEADGVDGPVSGVTLHFDAGTTGGSVSPASAVTDALGRASVRLTLGTTTGPQQFNATGTGLTPAAITAIATAVPTAMTKAGGDGQVDSVGTALKPFSVKVTDAFGNPVPGATINWSVTTGSGSLSAVSSTTDVSGQATITYTLGKTPEVATVRAVLSGTAIGVNFSATAIARGVATLVVTAGDGQTGVVGTSLPVSVTVLAQDVLGNPVAGATVKFAAVTAGGSITPASAVTDAAGHASGVIKLGATPQVYQFTATVGTHTVTINATAQLTGGVGARGADGGGL